MFAADVSNSRKFCQAVSFCNGSLAMCVQSGVADIRMRACRGLHMQSSKAKKPWTGQWLRAGHASRAESSS